MSSLRDRIAPSDPANPYLRVTLYTSLSLLCKGAELLSRLPDLTTAFETEDLERFRLLSAADAALGWLVGSGTDDSVDSLGQDSALGDAAAVLDWTDQQVDEHFTAGLADWTGVS